MSSTQRGDEHLLSPRSYHRRVCMTNPTNLTETLSVFRKPSEVTRARLRLLSDLRERDYPVFWSIWQALPTASRLRAVTLMNEISEDLVDYDFKPVMRWALQDADADVRLQAIDGLSEEENPRIIEPLVALLTSDTHPKVRSQAALALARFCEYAALEELSPQSSTLLAQQLKGALASNRSYEDVYRRIIEALAWIADDEVHALIADAWQQSAMAVRESALLAMGRSMDARWYATIKQALDNGHPALRYEAARAVGLFGDEAVTCIPQLINLAQDDDIEVAEAAIWALGQIDDPRSRRALEQLSKSRDQAKRDAALDVLGAEASTDDIFGDWRNAFRSTDDDDDDDDED